MTGYSGGAFDTGNNQFLMWGGGHGDYSGNEIYAFKIDSLKWFRIWGPTPNANIPTNPPGNYLRTYSDGNPVARHTYDNLVYLPRQNRLWAVGGSIWSIGNAQRDVWTMEMDSLANWVEWDSLANDGGGTASLIYQTDYDPGTGTVLVHGNKEFMRYDPTTETTTNLGEFTAGLGTQNNGAYDPVRKIFLLLGDSKVRLYNLNNTPPLSCRDTTSSCTGDTAIILGDSQAIQYDPVSDRFVIWRGGGAIYSLNMDTMAFTRHMPAATNKVLPGDPEPTGTWGRFQYVPSKNVFMVYSATGSFGSGTIDSSVYFFKMPYITRVDVPLKRWIAVPSPADPGGVDNGSCVDGGCKHIRVTYSPYDKTTLWFGGDWGDEGSSNQQFWKLKFYADSLNWTQVHGECPSNEWQPGGPDETGWTYDTDRNVAWLIPGYMNVRGNLPCGSDSVRSDSSAYWTPSTSNWSWSGYTKWDSLAAANVAGAQAQYWNYDPKSDRIIGMCDGAVGLSYNPANGLFTKYNWTTDSLGLDVSANLGKTYQAIDSTGGWVYCIDPYDSTSTNGSSLYAFNTGTQKLFNMGKLPRQCIQGPFGYQDQNLIWDSTNRVLIWNRNYEDADSVRWSQLFVYTPDNTKVPPTGTWEEMPNFAAQDWNGVLVQHSGSNVKVQGRVMAYDAHQNLVMITGTGQDTGLQVPYIFLFRYGNGSGTASAAQEEEEGGCAAGAGL